MSFDAHANLWSALVAVAPTPATSGTSLTVTAGMGATLPTLPFNNLTVAPAGAMPTAATAEIVRVTGVAGDTLTIVRGPQSADPGGINRAILTGDQIFLGVTQKSLTDVESAITAETSRAEAAEATLAPLASPALTGTPTAPTAAAGDDSTKLATTAYADGAVAVEKSRAQTAESTNASAIAAETTRAENAEALKAPLASPTFTGVLTAPAVAVSGLTGATAGGRYVGTTTTGAPTSGTFLVGDWCTDQAGKRWTCTTAGSPGTWTQEPGSGVSTSSANVFTQQQTFNNGGFAVRIQDGSSNNVAKWGNIASAGNIAAAALFFGTNAPGAGSGFGAWNFGVDTAATTPYRDFFLSKVTAAGAVSDPDGLYISNGGAAQAAGVGIGFAQPNDTGNRFRLKVMAAGTAGSDTAQGSLQIPFAAGQTGDVLNVQQSAGLAFKVDSSGQVTAQGSSAQQFRVQNNTPSTVFNVDTTSAAVVQAVCGTMSVGPGALATNPGVNTFEVRQSSTNNATVMFRSGGGNGVQMIMSNTASTGFTLTTTNASAVGMGSNNNVTTIRFGTTAGTLGFFNTTPIAQPSGTPAAATDLATVITLANSLRTNLLALGLVA